MPTPRTQRPSRAAAIYSLLRDHADTGLTPEQIHVALDAEMRPPAVRFISATLAAMAPRKAAKRGVKIRCATGQWTRLWHAGPVPPNRGRIHPACPTCRQALTGAHRHAEGRAK